MDNFSAPGEVLDRNGACLRILGQRELIPADVRAAAGRGVERTKQNSKLRNSLVYKRKAYTSRFEMTAAVGSAVHDHLDSSLKTNKEDGMPDGSDSIQMWSLEQNMFTADNPLMDLLIRTSGVERLSDFLL
ncbi:hypothetical protein PWT90_02440 [Aphanocladium album]|nr:hypothetical protein PWT90_02440 [Aphanocladium album]